MYNRNRITKRPTTQPEIQRDAGWPGAICALVLLAAFVVWMATGCAPALTAPPQARNVNLRARAALQIDMTCSLAATAGTGVDRTVWSAMNASRSGSGVIVGPRTARTANHVVDCVGSQTIHATLSDGRVLRMVVASVDREHDIATLELASGGTFGIAAPTPLYGGERVGYRGCVATPRGEKCGLVIDRQGTRAWLDLDGRKGDSGSGVYDEAGHLIGVTTRACIDGRCAVAADVQ